MLLKKYRQSLRITRLGLISALAAYASSQAASYQYYRFAPSKVSSGGTAIQLSEFEFLKAGVRVPFPEGTTVQSSNPATDGNNGNEAPILLTDTLLYTKWYNGGDGAGGLSFITFDVGNGNKLDIDAYRFATAAGDLQRRPVSWYLLGSNDGFTWSTLDGRQDYPTPETSTTYTPELALPAKPPVHLHDFHYEPAIVENGTPFSFTYQADNATSVVLTPSNRSVSLTGDTVNVTPANNTETTYTLTAKSTASGTQEEKQFTVRSVAAASRTYRYVRFTPLSTGSGSVNLSDILFSLIDSKGAHTAVAPVQVTYDGESTVDADDSYRPDNLRDDDITTEWYNPALRPVVFDFGSAKTINHYQFILGAALSTADGSPVKWRFEGTNNKADATSWTVIESVNSFAYPLPQGIAYLPELPFPSSASTPFEFSNFAAVRNAGSSNLTTLSWSGAGVGTLTLKAGSAAPVTLSPTATSVVVTPPAQKTVYTLTATSYQNPSATPVSFSLTLQAPEATPSAVPNYPDIELAGDAVALNGDAKFTNNSATASALTGLGDKTKLILAPDITGGAGTAFFKTPVQVSNGFDTTFVAYLAQHAGDSGAYGLSFVIQNTADGASNLPQTQYSNGYPNAARGPADHAVAVGLKTWDWDGSNQNTGYLEIYRNQSALQRTRLASTPVTLNKTPSLTGNYAGKSYKVHITYTSAHLLSVWVDDVSIVSGYPLELGDAVDSSGRGYVGLSSASEVYLPQEASVSSWVLSTGDGQSPGDLKIASYSFNIPSATAVFTWKSTVGTKYRITRSSALDAWTQVGATTTATAAETTLTVPIPAGQRDFFRVEVVP